MKKSTPLNTTSLDAASAALTELLDQIVAGEFRATVAHTAFIFGARAALDEIRAGQ